jgi:hypothetical protein
MLDKWLWWMGRKNKEHHSNLKKINIILDCGINDGLITDGTKYVSKLLEQNQIKVKSLWLMVGIQTNFISVERTYASVYLKFLNSNRN